MKKFLFVLVGFFFTGQVAFAGNNHSPQNTYTVDIVVNPYWMSNAAINTSRITEFNNAQELEISYPSGCRLWRVTLPFVNNAGFLVNSVSDITAQANGGTSNGVIQTQQGGGNSTPYTSGQNLSISHMGNLGVGQYSDLNYVFSCANPGNQNVVVALIDSGVNMNHPYFNSLGPNFFTNFHDFILNEDYVIDESGHGTFIAGTMAEQSLPIGANNFQIMPLRVLDRIGRGNIFNVIKAIDWAILHGADVINMSFDFESADLDLYLSNQTGRMDPLTRTIFNAISQNIIVVCSAGNNGSKTTKVYPANYSLHIPELVVVGSLYKDGNTPLMSNFSNYGDNVDIFAPGENLVYPTLLPKEYATMNGTSMASGLVSGAIAGALSAGNSVQDIYHTINTLPFTLQDHDNDLHKIFDLTGICDPFIPIPRMYQSDNKDTNNKSQSETIEVYPIPSSDNLVVKLNIEEQSVVAWSIYSLDGKKIFSGKTEVEAGDSIINIILPETPGTYRLVVALNGNICKSTNIVKL